MAIQRYWLAGWLSSWLINVLLEWDVFSFAFHINCLEQAEQEGAALAPGQQKPHVAKEEEAAEGLEARHQQEQGAHEEAQRRAGWIRRR